MKNNFNMVNTTSVRWYIQLLCVTLVFYNLTNIALPIKHMFLKRLFELKYKCVGNLTGLISDIFRITDMYNEIDLTEQAMQTRYFPRNVCRIISLRISSTVGIKWLGKYVYWRDFLSSVYSHCSRSRLTIWH